MGSRSRLLKFDPGVYTTVSFVNNHWDEVYLMSGDLIVGNDASLPRTLRRRQHMNLAS
jgi:hypothetical protein